LDGGGDLFGDDVVARLRAAARRVAGMQDDIVGCLQRGLSGGPPLRDAMPPSPTASQASAAVRRLKTRRARAAGGGGGDAVVVRVGGHRRSG
jgi:hypothetical protein